MDSPTNQGLGSIFASLTPIPRPPPTRLSQTVFRATLIQGVVRDSFPLTFGEGEGMKQVFSLVNPLAKLPSHQTMRRDLDKLYGILSDRVTHVMKVRQFSLIYCLPRSNIVVLHTIHQLQTARVSVTSDAWSSKSSVYSLAGVVVTFIDKHWNLQELVLDVVHLAADHSGKMMGHKIFQSLARRSAAQRLIASVSDNASNNRTMNLEIARRAKSAEGYDLNVQNMTITCVCHAMHLICRYDTQLDCSSNLLH